MRKSPKESATIFKVGTRKEGLDGYYYYVLTDKNKRKRWVKEGCLFVIYKINPTTKKNHWTYGKFPGNWQLVGSGTVVSIQGIRHGIPASLLKAVAHEIAPALRFLFQQSYDNATLPTQWKQALVTGIFKKGKM